MKNRICSTVFSLLLAPLVLGSVVAQDTPPPTTDETPGSEQTDSSDQEFTANTLNEKASYLIGYQTIKGLKADSVDFDIELLIQGMRDAADGNDPPMSDEEIAAVQKAFNNLMIKKREQEWAALADKNMRAGMEFLKTNATAEGVKELENGIQYKVLQEGTGTESPRLTDRVRVHYKGTFLDGSVFDSSLGGEPAVFSVGGTIRGFASVLQNMKVGDKWLVHIPGDLAYGPGPDNLPPGLGPNQLLTFELELLEIVK